MLEALRPRLSQFSSSYNNPLKTVMPFVQGHTAGQGRVRAGARQVQRSSHCITATWGTARAAHSAAQAGLSGYSPTQKEELCTFANLWSNLLSFLLPRNPGKVGIIVPMWQMRTLGHRKETRGSLDFEISQGPITFQHLFGGPTLGGQPLPTQGISKTLSSFHYHFI